LDVVAERLAFGKTVNAGQTCLAPDYVYVHSSIKDKLVERLKVALKKFYGDNPQTSSDYSRVINKRHVGRLNKYLQESKESIVHGGEVKEEDCYISPTLLVDPSLKSTVMQEEIFGPILPIHGYDVRSHLLFPSALHPYLPLFLPFRSSTLPSLLLTFPFPSVPLASSLPFPLFPFRPFRSALHFFSVLPFLSFPVPPENHLNSFDLHLIEPG